MSHGVEHAELRAPRNQQKDADRASWVITASMGNRVSRYQNATSHRNRNSYRKQVRALSARLVEAQRSIRILDAIKWDKGVEYAFFAGGGCDPPPITPDYYRSRLLPFAPEAKIEELHGIER